MADRRITVLNPGGYQEVLQTSDRLFVDSSSQLAQTEFTGTVTGTDGAFTGSLTVEAVPSAPKDVVTLDFLQNVELELSLTASLPITLNNKVIGIEEATESAQGSVRFATQAEVDARSAVNAAVQPSQLDAALDNLSVSGVAPIQITEDVPNHWNVEIDYATASDPGSVRFATDIENSVATLETVAVNPKQVADSIAQIPDASIAVRGLVKLATQADLDARSIDVAVTPAQLAESVDDVGMTANLPLTVTETNNVFDIDINYATETADGTVRLSTPAEIAAGVSTTTVVTPADLEARLDVLEIVDGSTTVKGLVRFATNSETATGTEADAAVTPVSLRYALDQDTYILDGGTY